ncbi:MAG TPA: hypothetical protein DIV44_14845 [Leeuwenhoekiella sp.]|nr:hypothetical protein [Leeuwenhoekiella sp.]HBO28525.1 hypothetical protein [Leeuwenhoekiella sp.]HCQ78084.1 hypothetical protein [Leeuwenhoekiella sp.]|tara:strand:+ start:19096 stop:20058 length:963 start_codon:yes stop_codon:yes gene_type:complete
MDLVNKPLVSVIIPTYRRVELLKETLINLIEQEYSSWEAIVVDDGSDSDIICITSQYTNLDERIFFYQRPNFYPKGASGSRNFGLSQAKGKYIQWLDDDDLLSVEKILKQVEVLEKSDSFKKIAISPWAYSYDLDNFKINVINNSESFYSVEEILKYFTENETFIPLHSYLMPKKLINFSGLWNVNLNLNLDAEFMLRVLMCSEEVINVSQGYCIYRSHEMPSLSSNVLKKTNSRVASLQLMNAHLNSVEKEFAPYFKWRLSRVFNSTWRDRKQRNSLERYKWFFKNFDIDFRLSYYYFLKKKIYQLVYPRIKSLKRKSN